MHCLDNYDDAAYDKIELIPPSLTQRVYDQGDAATKQVLEHKLTRKTGTFSDLLTGQRSYISRNPDQFREYYQIRANEVGLLKAVLKKLSNDDKRKLRDYYQENVKLEPEKFSDTIASHSSSPSSKRPRSLLESKTGGTNSTSRFRLENRIDIQDEFFDGSDLMNGGGLYDQDVLQYD
jgi:hypothetical protein